MKRVLVIAAFLLGTFAGVARAETKIHGYAMGDAYWFAGHHVEAFKNLTGFQFRRVYLTFDNDLGGGWGSRFRFEADQTDNNGGDTGVDWDIDVKDAYLKYKSSYGGGHTAYLGVSGSLSFGLTEKFWGYRPVEKAPQDLAGWRSSRELGFKVKGNFDEDKKFGYAVMVGNGDGFQQESNTNKAFSAALTAKPVKGLLVELYADYFNNSACGVDGASGPGNCAINSSDYIVAAFAGYKGDWGRVGTRLSHRVDEQGNGAPTVANGFMQPDRHMNLFTLFGVAKLTDKWSAYARWDYMDYPAAARPTYFNSRIGNARPHFIVFGADWAANKSVHLMPNVEIFAYGKAISLATDGGVVPNTIAAAGVAPKSIVIPRITFYYKFK